MVLGLATVAYDHAPPRARMRLFMPPRLPWIVAASSWRRYLFRHHHALVADDAAVIAAMLEGLARVLRGGS